MAYNTVSQTKIALVSLVFFVGQPTCNSFSYQYSLKIADVNILRRLLKYLAYKMNLSPSVVGRVKYLWICIRYMHIRGRDNVTPASVVGRRKSFKLSGKNVMENETKSRDKVTRVEFVHFQSCRRRLSRGFRRDAPQCGADCLYLAVHSAYVAHVTFL